MALSTKLRHSLPKSAFKGPNKSYPVPTAAEVGPAKAHATAAAAKAYASRFASPEMKARVDAAANKVLGKTKGK